MALASDQPFAHLFTVDEYELRKRAQGNTPGIGHKQKHHKSRKVVNIEPSNKKGGKK